MQPGYDNNAERMKQEFMKQVAHGQGGPPGGYGGGPHPGMQDSFGYGSPDNQRVNAGMGNETKDELMQRLFAEAKGRDQMGNQGGHQNYTMPGPGSGMGGGQMGGPQMGGPGMKPPWVQNPGYGAPPPGFGPPGSRISHGQGPPGMPHPQVHSMGGPMPIGSHHPNMGMGPPRGGPPFPRGGHGY
jgi:hypothetical protein